MGRVTVACSVDLAERDDLTERLVASARLSTWRRHQRRRNAGKGKKDMMRGKMLPAITVAVLLGLVLGGGAVAAITIPNDSIGWQKLTKGVRARIRHGMVRRPGALFPGPTGPTGPQGPAGPEGAAPESVYGTLIPGFGESLLAHLDPARSQHVALARPLEGSGPGTWCFALEGREAAKATVLATPTELPIASVEEAQVPVVEWLPAASDCEAGQVEIRTWIFTKPEEGAGPRTYSSLIPFSFVVEGGS